LPDGLLLRADGIEVTERQIEQEIAQNPPAIQPQLQRAAILVLEKHATGLLLERAARTREAPDGSGTSASGEELAAHLLRTIGSQATVSDAEMEAFHRANLEMFEGASLEAVRPGLAQYLLQQKRQQLVEEHIRTLGQRVEIVVNEAWAIKQAERVQDNPVDRARRSGQPSLVDFGAHGCTACDMMTPILESLARRYEGRANVLFVPVREEQVLAMRYGIQSIPVQVFFDGEGREVFRHQGFLAQEAIERKLGEMGVQ
jgi:thiol-disulfide isomerase/thioredoxin